MKIGMNFYRGGCFSDLSVEDTIALMKDNGFEGTFMGNEHEIFPQVVEAARKAGIAMETIHAPFDKINDMWRPGEEGDEMLRRLVRSFEDAARYDIPVVVLHMSSGYHPPMIGDVGNARFRQLMETADRLGVTPAIENQRLLANISLMFEYYDNARFCWDIGHEACFTPGREYMPLFGHKLAALHVQDNMCNFNEDLHMLPYDGKIDFDKAARYIAKSGFRGTVMLEVMARADCYARLSGAEFYARAAKAARKLADTIDFYR